MAHRQSVRYQFMINDFLNPFADYGNIVYGNRFIGRKDDLKVVDNRIIRPKEAGNLAIIGEPRIGKSSLIYNAIMMHKNELVSQKYIPIWINLATYEKISPFFCSLAISCFNEMEKINLSKGFNKEIKYILDEKKSDSEKYLQIQRFFEKVRQEGYRVLFILDEFDHARNLFKCDISGFQKLRELSYRPEWRVTFISISRRSIREIEMQTKAISTFDGIFYKHYLGMFNEEDMNEYFQKLSYIGLTINPNLTSKVEQYCGSHPYLLEILGYEISEMFREESKFDLDKATSLVEQSFVSHYEHVIELLREDGSLNKLLQILFGPVVDVKQTDVDTLLKYGVIHLNNDGSYVGFSKHFHSYLSVIHRECDLWPIWSKTEKLLRQLITTEMVNKYGNDWIILIEKGRPNLKAIFEKCREAQKKEEKLFGTRASLNLIDFTYPQDLFTIMFTEWDLFSSTLGKDKNYWSQRIQIISKVRNPLAHNRDDILHEYEKQIVEGYCNEILSTLNKVL